MSVKRESENTDDRSASPLSQYHVPTIANAVASPTYGNSQRCEKENGDQADPAHARKLQSPDQRDRKRNDGGIGNDIRHVGANNKVLKIKALHPRDVLVPCGPHGLALKDGDEKDGHPPGHDKGNHTVAQHAEFAVDTEDAQVQAQYGALDQGDVGGVVKLAQVRVLSNCHNART